MRYRIYQLVHVTQGEGKAARLYDGLMIAAIIVSLIPLCFKQYPTAFFMTDAIVTALFIVDYGLRWATADFKLRRGWESFLLYPFTPMAIVDLISILPFFLPMNRGFKALRLLRLVRALRAIRYIRESRSFQVIAAVLDREKSLLMSVGALAVGYIVACALVVFNVEPESFDNFFEAIYWACVSLTTVGYGDVYPVTEAGRVVTMVSSLVGVALIALPAGIITGGYIDEMRKGDDGGRHVND
ncbi:MAG: potassium channel family protein [Adlercreutzia sp.]|nr:potassium channel family protein [Adlercreutzia sp.]